MKDDGIIRHALCPFCGKVTDRASPLHQGDQVQMGDLSMCIACGEFSIFALVPGGLRKPTDAEYLDFAMQPEIKRIREVWVEVMKGRPP